jgi:hypothetical protein
VGGVGLEIRPIAILSRAIQVEVFVNQLHKLVLNLSKFIFGELIFIRLYLSLSEIPEESKLVLEQEEKGFTFACCSSGCPTDSMDIVLWIIGRVILNNPIN